MTANGIYLCVMIDGAKALIPLGSVAAEVPVDPPSPSRWSPANLDDYFWTRPTGTDYVTWESIVGSTVAAAQAASPTTPVTLTRSVIDQVTGNRIFSLPKGIFELPGFGSAGYVNKNMLGFGQGYSSGCRGIVGAGSQSTPGAGGAETIIRMSAAVATQGIAGNMLIINARANAYVGGISFRGQQVRGDGTFHGGIILNSCNGGLIENCYFRGCAPGYANFPPGETFVINIFKSQNVKILMCEIDGRDKNAVRTDGSPIGWNTVNSIDTTANTVDFTLVERTYAHHGLTGMLTFWETENIKTVDYYCFSWAWGKKDAYSDPAQADGQYRGSGINHEQSWGKITHVRPTLLLCSQKSTATGIDKTFNQGGTFGIASVVDDVGARMRVEDLIYDKNHNSDTGMVVMSGYGGYKVTTPRYAGRIGWDYMLTCPVVIVAGRTLIPSKQRLALGAAGINGWNTKDPTIYLAWATG